MHVPKGTLRAGIDAPGLEGEIHAGVENAAGLGVGGGGDAFDGAVVGEAAADARGDIEPAKPSLRQGELMDGVGAGGGVVGVGGLVGVGKIAPEIADGGFALVENGRVAQLLAQAGESARPAGVRRSQRS